MMNFIRLQSKYCVIFLNFLQTEITISILGNKNNNIWGREHKNNTKL